MSYFNSKENDKGCLNFFLAILVWLCIHVFIILNDAILVKGRETEAIIEQVWPGYKNDESYISYSFVVDSIIYFDSFVITNKTPVTVGQIITVKYQAKKPYNSKAVSITDNQNA